MPIQVTEDHSDTSLAPTADTAHPYPSRTAKRGRIRRSADLFEDDEHAGVSRLYTVAMMADVLRVPTAAVRHWLRGGLLVPARRSGSIEWFEFPQIVLGRQLVRLLNAGLSLREIDAKLAAFAPGGAAEAARMAEHIVTDGRRLSLLRDDRPVGAGGQLLLGFYADGLTNSLPMNDPKSDPTSARVSHVVTLPISSARRGSPSLDTPPASWGEDALDDHLDHGLDHDPVDTACVTDLLDLAADLAAAGSLAEAAEALRAVLQAQGPTAHVIFMLAELLYRSGDLTAARERYYAVIEIDADHLEARASLGCVLAELGEHELALAALDGVLRQQPNYADAHWHMAGVLRDTGREEASRRHLLNFLSLAPESPWASMARELLANGASIGR